MVATFRYPSATDGFMPVATNMVIGFIRKEDQFPMNRYVQKVEAPATTFYYFELDPDQSVRIRNGPLNVWADGADRPQRRDNQFGFRTVQNTVVRYDHASSMGNIALSLCDKNWNAKQVYMQGLASQAMTLKTATLWQGVSTGTGSSTGGWLGLDNVSSWLSSNVGDVNTLNGNAGPWSGASSDQADASFMAIRKSLYEAATRIFLATNGTIKWSDLRLVVSPNQAKAMGNTGEIRDFYKYGPYAKEAIETAMSPNFNEEYGLPPKLYGIEVCVEDSMIITDPPLANATTSFSTVQEYWYEYQLKMQQFSDPINEVTNFHATDQYTFVLSASRAGFLITGLTL